MLLTALWKSGILSGIQVTGHLRIRNTVQQGELAQPIIPAQQGNLVIVWF